MEPLSDDYLRRFSEAVVREIKAEMGRKGVDSARALARLTGMTHTSINDRLRTNPRTGKPVVINVRDLAAFGHALGVEPAEFVTRAKAALELQVADPAAGSGGYLTSVIAELDPEAPAKTSKPAYSMEEADRAAARDEDREKPRLD